MAKMNYKSKRPWKSGRCHCNGTQRDLGKSQIGDPFPGQLPKLRLNYWLTSRRWIWMCRHRIRNSARKAWTAPKMYRRLRWQRRLHSSINNIAHCHRTKMHLRPSSLRAEIQRHKLIKPNISSKFQRSIRFASIPIHVFMIFSRFIDLLETFSLNNWHHTISTMAIWWKIRLVGKNVTNERIWNNIVIKAK